MIAAGRSRAIRRGAIVLLLGITASVNACTRPPDAGRTLSVTPLESPAPVGSAEPNLTAGPDGRVYLSWIEEGEGSSALRFSVLGPDHRWSSPRTVASAPTLFVNAADFPSLAVLADGTLAAHWLVARTKGSSGYDVAAAVSTDEGRSWTPPVRPHRDASPAEHGFVSIVPVSGSSFALAWLDGRQLAGGAAHPADHAADMALMSTALTRDGAVDREVVVDPRVCECCQTAAVPIPGGLALFYRDRSADEVRDIAVVRRLRGSWTAPENLSQEQWRINGCPINGPAASAIGNAVAVAWFSAPDYQARVHVALSSDGAASFAPRVRVDEGNPLGRVDVAARLDGPTVVSWVERTPEGATLAARAVESDGTLGPVARVADVGASRSGGFPRLESASDRIIAAWTDARPGGRVLVAAIQ